MQTVIETKSLCKTYGRQKAVDHVELHVPQGSVYGFIGPNGAGKSTTMKMLLGLIHPTEGQVLDPQSLQKLQDDLPNDEVLYDLAELFRVFGDTTSIKILYALFESELCVNDIAQVVGLSQSAVSHQLRLLKASKLVKFRREGKAIFYALDDDHVRSMIALGMEHVEE